MALTNTSHSNHHLPTLSSDSDFSPQPTYVDDGNTSTPRASIADSPTATVSPTDSGDRQATFKNRQSTQSTTSSNKANRTGLFNLAALARDKTTSAIASFTDPTIRTRSSSGNLARQSASSTSIAVPSTPKTSRTSTSQDDDISKQQENCEVPRASSSTLSPQNPRSQPSRGSSPSGQRQSLLDTDPPSQSYDTTDTNTPPPTHFVPQSNYNKMHQTSSRLLRMTDDERPFTRVRCTRQCIYQSHISTKSDVHYRISKISLRLSLSAYHLHRIVCV